jgi:16S rRNA (guanine527-N7)-methyltransferase
MPFVKNGGYFVAMKGEKGREEAEEAKKAISVLGGELVDIIDIKIPEFEYLHTLVLIKKTKSTPKNYPRRNSQIQKKPL